MEGLKPMRKILCTIALTGLLALGMTGAAFAQDNTAQQPSGQGGGGGGRRMDPDKQLERMTKELSLTSDQQTAIKPILVDQDQKMQAIFQDQSIAREDRRTKMMAIRDDSKTKIEAVLTPDQKQKYETMQQNMRRGGGGPPPQN
jgi:protein CpxP